jgi:hypothetical protein
MHDSESTRNEIIECKPKSLLNILHLKIEWDVKEDEVYNNIASLGICKVKTHVFFMQMHKLLLEYFMHWKYIILLLFPQYKVRSILCWKGCVS